MTKNSIILIIALVLAVSGLLLLWQKQPQEQQEPPAEEKIILESPKPNEVISTPWQVKGKARGNWFFEASFPIKLLDQNGNKIAVAIAQAQGEWMTTEFVPFKAQLNFAVATDTSATLVLVKDNPSGLPELNEQKTIPVFLKAAEALKDLGLDESEAMTVKVFFNNSQMDPEFSCNKVFAIERKIAKTEAPARKALELLLEGALTFAEQEQGFGSSINPGVKIQRLTIENGAANVDFDEQMQFQVGGSCRVSAIRAQITETLKQFPTVDNVIISINGRTEDILQP